MTIVHTSTGQLEGVTRYGIHAFLGVPYAAAPVGPLRFRATQPAPAWSGVRPTKTIGPVFLQRPMRGTVGEVMPLNPDQSFDALTLNIWTPDLGAANLPVVLFIHGGGYYSGAGSDELYDGSQFARDGVVTVTINYRLGVDGFLFHPDVAKNEDAHGGFGVADQISALRWVRDNIAAFGGDPDQVTVAGESAGAMSVGTILAAPSARGLFRRAILQSGAPDKTANVEVADRISRRFLHHLGNPSVEELQATSAERTLAVQADMAAELTGPDGMELYGQDAFLQTILFVPVYGTPLIPVNPMSVDAPTTANVDVLMGDNLTETAIFLNQLPDDALTGLVNRYMSLILGQENVPVARRAFQQLAKDNREALIKLDSERQFGMPIRQFASTLANRGHRVFKYRFEQPNMARPKLGSHHLLELPYVFDSGHTAQARNLAGPLNAATRDAVRRAWISFIQGSTPALRHDIWPLYSSDREIAIFREGSHLGLDHAATSWQDWLV